MKKIVLLQVILALAMISSAQKQLHIHHINIENGDATLIGIFDVTQQKYTSKILIDGGQDSADIELLPYISKMIGNDAESFHFDYIILSHYHNDHYNGLLAIKDGRLTADSIIDPGGYTVSTIFTHSVYAGVKPDSLKRALAWLDALKVAAHHNPPFVKGRSKIMIRYSTTPTTTIGNTISIGSIGTNKVELRCIAGWGNTLSENGHYVPNPFPKKSNANNFTLAFILSCGEFRYFIGGDMGGSNAGSYIDQETTVTKFLEDEYPVARSIQGDVQVKGHVCGFKSNHHGSNNSNTANFMKSMHPSINITSAGNNKSWHLPGISYLQRLADVIPLSVSTHTSDTMNRGLYFTNLYDFTSGASRTKANDLFDNKPGISYDFGNNTITAKGSYLIKITNEDHLHEKSEFEVGRVDIDNPVPYKKLADFFCHTK